MVAEYCADYYILEYFHIFQGYSSLSEDLQLCLNVDKTDESIHSGSQVFSVPPRQSDEDAVGQPLHNRWANQAATGESIFIDDMRPLHGKTIWLYKDKIKIGKPSQ